MALKVFLLVCLLVATTVAFRAPVSSRYSMVSKSSLSMKSNTAGKVATGALHRLYAYMKNHSCTM